MENLKHLELRSPKEKAMWVKEIAKHPELLLGCESQEFFERVGEYLVNVESTIQQKKEFIDAYYADGCAGYSNKDKLN